MLKALAAGNFVSRMQVSVCEGFVTCRSRVHFSKSLMIPKIRMFYVCVFTDFFLSLAWKMFRSGAPSEHQNQLPAE